MVVGVNILFVSMEIVLLRVQRTCVKYHNQSPSGEKRVFCF